MSTSLPPPPADGLALPPPAAVARPPLVRPYRSGRSFAITIGILLLGVVVVSGADAAANLDAADLVEQLKADASAVTLADIETSDARTNVSAALQRVLILVAFGFLVAWTSRSYRNLRSLGVGHLRFTEGWAVGAWFIPLFNLIRPKQIVNDIWRGSGRAEAEDPDWHRRQVPPLLHVWWAAWIVAGVVLLSASNDPKGIDEVRRNAITSVVGDVALVVAALLAIAVLIQTTNRQDLAAGQPPRSSRLWVVAAVLSVLGAIATFGVSYAAFAAIDEPASRSAAGDTPSTTSATGRGRRTVLPLELRPGDCIDAAPGKPARDETVTIVAVNVVDCATPHDMEAVGRITHPADKNTDFPSDEALSRYSTGPCIDEFEAWVGRPYDESELLLGAVVPHAEAWKAGQRTIVCYVVLQDGDPLVGSVRSSRR